MRFVAPYLVLISFFVSAPSASAQVGTAQQPPVISSSPGVGARGFFAIDLDTMAAKDSFNAVLGTSRLTAFGGGVDVINLWKGLFVRGAVSRSQKDGNRAFVFNGQAISLNVPITVTVTPVELGAGWRLPTKSPFRPYVGGGALWTRYQEESNFANADDNVSKTTIGYAAFGGLEVGIWKFLMAGVEGQYRRVPDALGVGPVSEDFGETDLGGFSVRVLFGFSR